VIPFVACGKNEEFDADMNYSLKTKFKKVDNDVEETKENSEY